MPKRKIDQKWRKTSLLFISLKKTQLKIKSDTWQIYLSIYEDSNNPKLCLLLWWCECLHDFHEVHDVGYGMVFVYIIAVPIMQRYHLTKFFQLKAWWCRRPPEQCGGKYEILFWPKYIMLVVVTFPKLFLHNFNLAPIILDLDNFLSFAWRKSL